MIDEPINLTHMINQTRINLKHLRAFRAVAHHSSFTRAAEALGISQPALSALIVQLEEDLGAKLIHRTTRAVELTSIGREFLASCERILPDIDSAIADVRDFAQLRRGRLRIAALPSISRTLLPATLRAFRKKHVPVTVSVVDVLGDALIERVLTGQVDIGIGFALPSADLRCEKLLTDQLVAVAPADMFGGSSKRIRWRDLASHDIIAMHHGTTVRRIMEDSARQANVTLRVILEPEQMPTAIAYARAGLGIAVLPTSALIAGEEPGVTSVPIVAPVAKRQLSVLSRRLQAMSPAAEAFAGMLRDHVASQRGSFDHLTSTDTED